MVLLLLYLFHEYVAKTLIPRYKLRNELYEASNHLIECLEKEFEEKREKTILKTILNKQNEHKSVRTAKKDFK